MNIIVEGPDGGGKSTLIHHLSKALLIPVHEKASDSVAGPIPTLAAWVDKDISADWTQRWIYDRYPTISEPIYGRLVRGRIQPPFHEDAYLANVNEVLYRTAVVVWCIPNLETVSANIAANAHDQMPGVVANIGNVHQAYMTAYFRWRGPKRQYDYNRHDLAWFTDNLQRMMGQ